MKSKIYTSFLSAAMLLATTLFFSCKKDPTAPPMQAVATGPAITIQQLRNMYNGINIKFTSNTILNAVVTCDEASGNLYKQVYIRDNSGAFALTKNYGAISLHFTQSTQGLLNVGDSIAVNLNGATLDKSGGGSLQLDSLIAINQIVHLKSGLNPQPLVVTMPQLNTYSNTVGGGFIYDGQLVQLNNVEFISSEVGTTYAIPQAPPAAPQNVNKYIGDSLKNTMVTYNSGYANFAGQFIPNNSGSLVAVANLYTTMQLTIRSFSEVNFTKPYNTIVYDSLQQNFSCAGLASKSPVLLTGWTSIAYKGSIYWQGTQYGNPFSLYGNPLNWKYAPGASNYKTNDDENDMWLISPPIKDHGAAGNYLDFSMVEQYGTSIKLLTVLISTSFDGTHLDPSQWQDISSIFPNIPPTAQNPSNNGVVSFKYTHPGSSLFTPSPVQLAVPANNGTFYIAFRYQSNRNYVDSTGCTYLLGNIVLK